MAAVTVRVPAKINIYLGVGPATASGFHDLATVFQAVSIFDDVTAEPAPVMSIEVCGPWAYLVPADDSNLAWRAAQLVADAAGTTSAFALVIDKSIPVAGGLAGGSADGAAALVACNEALGSPLDWAVLEGLAAQLGSDVPFLLHGGCALGTGRGIELAPVMTRGSFHWVLATFTEGLSTAAIYAGVDRLRGGAFDTAPQVPAEVLRALAHGDARLLGAHLGNDLQPAALEVRPQLAAVLDEGTRLGAVGAVVSGSGPTCVFLADSESHALDIAVGLRASGLVDAATPAHGPVHGARVAVS